MLSMAFSLDVILKASTRSWLEEKASRRMHLAVMVK